MCSFTKFLYCDIISNVMLDVFSNKDWCFVFPKEEEIFFHELDSYC